MREVAKRFYFQKKNWESVEILREVRDDDLRMSPEEKAAHERQALQQLEEIQVKCAELATNRRYIKAPWLTLLFRWATKASLLVAEQFEMNVIVEEDDHTGIIRFTTDQIISERIWRDQRYRNRLLWLMRWADGVWIDNKEENGQTLVQIALSYKTALAKRFRNC